MQQTTLINESGVYSLIFGSKLETAKSFKKWVTSEVLPSIRKTGSYSVIPSYQIEDPIKRAEKWIEEQKEKKALEIKVGELSVENKELEKRIEEDAPKVIFAMAVTESKRSCLVAELAKIICQNGNLSKRNGDRTKQIIQVVKKERLSGDKRRILQSAYATLCRSRIV